MGWVTEILLPFFAVLFLLVVVHEFGHFIVAKLFGMLVEEFGFGMPPRIVGKRFGETLYSLNWLPIGGFVRIYGETEENLKKDGENERAFHIRPWWQQALVLLAGPAMNILLAVGILTVLFTKGTYIPSSQVRVTNIEKASPAQIAGIQKGDVITSIEKDGNDNRVQLMGDVSRLAQQYKGETVVVRIKREGKTQSITVAVREKPAKGQGYLGVEISQFEFVKVPWYQAPGEGVRHAFRISSEFYSELGRALSKVAVLQNPQVEVAGPVGIARITGSAAQSGPEVLWMFIALFSLNLALINLLPFPALDGGQLMFTLYEFITGKRVSAHFRTVVNALGFTILIGFMLMVTVVDIQRIIK